MLLSCKVCNGKVSSDAATCPHCGTADFRTKTSDERLELDFNTGGNCPVCKIGNLARMDAGSRGKAFGEGNLIGAFSKSRRCNNCGYLA